MDTPIFQYHKFVSIPEAMHDYPKSILSEERRQQIREEVANQLSTQDGKPLKVVTIALADAAERSIFQRWMRAAAQLSAFSNVIYRMV